MKLSLADKGALYRVSIAKDEFLRSGLETGYNFKIINDQVTFVTTKNNLNNLLKQYPDLSYRKRFVYMWKKNVVPKIISTFFVGLILILFLSSSSLIREIAFKQQDTYDKEVYDFVYQKLSKVGPFYFMQDGINSLSEELRETFIDYAWVGIERRGGKIIIDIERQEVGDHQGDDLTKTGNLIASKDGYVKGYLIERGVNLISINQSVKKGQLLVSGNLKYHNPSQEQWTQAKGLILADTVEYITKSIPKINKVTEYNGKTTSRLVFKLFRKTICTKKNPYQDSDIDVNEIFSLGFLKLTQEIIKEKQVITTVYNEQSGSDYAESMIIKEFRKDHQHPKEKINQIDLMITKSASDHYVYTFIVKKTENIAIFIRN